MQKRCCGRWTRTADRMVMSHASYHLQASRRVVGGGAAVAAAAPMTKFVFQIMNFKLPKNPIAKVCNAIRLPQNYRYFFIFLFLFRKIISICFLYLFPAARFEKK